MLTNEYRHLVHEVVDDCDTIVVEKLDAYEMRKRGKALLKEKASIADWRSSSHMS